MQRREALRLLGGAEANLLQQQRDETKGGGEGSVNSALNAAKALLAEQGEGGEDEAGSLVAVHSAKSVASLLQQAKGKIAALQQHAALPAAPAEPKVSLEPRIVVHEPSDGARLEAKHDISKLPYMHRNPSV